MSRFLSFISSLALCLSCLLGLAHAQSDAPARTPTRAIQAIGDTVADHPSLHYRFERHHIDSADGKRHYRIDIGIPWTRASGPGYPVLYMLDGNAAMDTLTEQDLALLSDANAPVLVAIGYDVATRHDIVSRAYDYTPSVRENGRLVAEPVVRGRVGGGADIFLRFINTRIKPLVQGRARLDADKAFLWGHSYGGLFTLHALFNQPQAFAGYIAGDPSLWWHDGALLEAWRAFEPSRAAGQRIAILIGTKPRDPARPAPFARANDKNRPPFNTRAAAEEISQGLASAGAHVHYEAFPQHGHGDMLRASLEHALRVASEP